MKYYGKLFKTERKCPVCNRKFTYLSGNDPKKGCGSPTCGAVISYSLVASMLTDERILGSNELRKVEQNMILLISKLASIPRDFFFTPPTLHPSPAIGDGHGGFFNDSTESIFNHLEGIRIDSATKPIVKMYPRSICINDYIKTRIEIEQIRRKGFITVYQEMIEICLQATTMLGLHESNISAIKEKKDVNWGGEIQSCEMIHIYCYAEEIITAFYLDNAKVKESRKHFYHTDYSRISIHLEELSACLYKHMSWRDFTIPNCTNEALRKKPETIAKLRKLVALEKDRSAHNDPEHRKTISNLAHWIVDEISSGIDELIVLANEIYQDIFTEDVNGRVTTIDKIRKDFMLAKSR